MTVFSQIKETLDKNIKLVGENEFPQNDKEIADEVNSFFKRTIPNLENTFYSTFYHKSDFPTFQQRLGTHAWVHMPALQLG